LSSFLPDNRYFRRYWAFASKHFCNKATWTCNRASQVTEGNLAWSCRAGPTTPIWKRSDVPQQPRGPFSVALRYPGTWKSHRHDTSCEMFAQRNLHTWPTKQSNTSQLDPSKVSSHGCMPSIRPIINVHKMFHTNLHMFSNYLTNNLTELSRALLEQLTVTQLLRKFPAFHGTWRFITMFTRARHWFLSSFIHQAHTFQPYFLHTCHMATHPTWCGHSNNI
jgi:hypothetical protein